MSALIDKIRKLHALSQDASNEAEAALAASRVQELVAKHNLDLGEVLLKGDPGLSMEAGERHNRIPSHATVLAFACDGMFDVRHFFVGRRHWGWRFTFIGLKANVEAAVVTYEYLIESTEALVRGAKAKDLIYGNQEFTAFRDGVAARILEMTREQKAEAVAANPAYGQLVHIGNALANTLHDAQEFRGTRGGWGGFSGGSAFSLGYSEGGRIDPSGARTGRMLK
jgi:hypothetical protein